MADITTEYLPGRGIRTTVPGMAAPVTPGALAPVNVQSTPFQAPGFLQGLDPDLIARLINERYRRTAPQAMPEFRQEAPRARYIEEGPQLSRPTLGATPADPNRDVITREVVDPQANPYHQLQTGFKPRTVRERLLPNGKWEFEDLRPQGGSGGIQGGGMGNGALAAPRGPQDGRMESQRETSMSDEELRRSSRLPSWRPPANATGMGRR